MRLRSEFIRTSVVSGTVGAFVAGGLAWAMADHAALPAAVPTAQANAPLLTPAGASTQNRNDVTGIVAKAVRSVVSVKATKVSPVSAPGPFGRFPFGRGMPAPQRGKQGVGSGVVVRAEGIILTNNHVVDGAQEISVVTADGREFAAEVAGTDAKTDLAVLRVKPGKKKLEALPLGNSESLKLGEPVLAIGNPFGVGQTVTQGIVSAKGRADLGINAYEDFIQTDAAINPGNSGGALVNMSGELIGINTAILSRSGGSMGIGFAIPTNMAEPIMTSLLETGHVDRGWLGVAIQDVNRDMSEALGLGGNRGVLIADVEAGSPAEKAGVTRGDVVLSVNGRATETVGQLRNAIALAGSTKSVTLGVWRNAKERSLTVKLGVLPETPQQRSQGKLPATSQDSTSLDGLHLSELTREWKERLRLPVDLDQGIVVTRVDATSPAARAGLRRGDVILELNRREMVSLDTFEKAWKASKKRRLILVQRGPHTHYLVIKG